MTSKTRVYDPVVAPDASKLINLSDNLAAQFEAETSAAARRLWSETPAVETPAAARRAELDIFGKNFVSLKNFNTVTSDPYPCSLTPI